MRFRSILQTSRSLLLGTLVLLIIFLSGFWFGKHTTSHKSLANTSMLLRKKDPHWQFISPLIACLSPDKHYYPQYAPLEEKLIAYIEKNKREKNIAEIGVYFRNLTTGHWIGVNENTSFFPASLFKVPIMIAYFKQSEREPGILEKKIFYNSQSSPSASDRESEIRPGYAYTVDELIEAMIVNSDNIAKDLLLDFVDPIILESVLNDLTIEMPGKSNSEEVYEISPRKYSLLFRVLYSASILNEELSEKALALLAKTNFEEGMTAKLPKDIKVAHKFGIHTSPPIGEELHDCGIIYKPDNPYFLCIMSKGNNLKVLEEISEMVFKEIGD